MIIKNVRANVPPEVVDTIKEVSRSFIRSVQHQIENNPRSKEYVLRRNAFQLSKHANVIKGEGELDLIVTQLRNLGYSSYEVLHVARLTYTNEYDRVVSFPETTYICGTTKDIICKRSIGGKINLGPYKIYLPLSLIGVGSGDGHPQFVPTSEPHIYGRFYHHHSDYAWEDRMTDPAQMGSATCWGHFDVNAIINSKMVGDIFSIFHRYLEVANMNSLYVHGGMPWGIDVK